MIRSSSCAVLVLILLSSSLWAQNAPVLQVYDGTALAPGSDSIANATGIVTFDPTPVAIPKSKTFTVKNVGTADLLLAEPIVVPPGFTLVSSFGTTTVHPGDSTTFAVALNAAKAGRLSGPLSFRTNDPLRRTFSFSLLGPVLPPPSLQILNDGSAGFSTVGTWTTDTQSGFQGDRHLSDSGDGTNTASWTFTGLLPGDYRVSATWSARAAPKVAATNAPFTLLDGTAQLATVAVNQGLAPDGFGDAGSQWQDLGGPYRITSGSLVVSLSNRADGTVIADAVRIERLGYPGQIADNSGGAIQGTWTIATNDGFQGTTQASAAGAGENEAYFIFGDLAPGQYRISVTWSPGADRATNAPYTLFVNNGLQPLTTVRVNQQLVPGSFSDAGATWEDLGGLGNLFPITGTALVVRLSNAANGTVIADAVRLQRVNTPQVSTASDTVRLLEQATFGPTTALIQQVRSIGFDAFLSEQFTAPASSYPTLPLMPTNQAVGCPAGSPATCVRDNYTMYPLQNRFFVNALYGPDQLRQRVAFALHEIFVISGVDIPQPSWMAPYLQILDRNGFGNYRQLLEEITLNPGMGTYLSMAGSTKAAPNENYAREILQLFSIGLDQLNPDGTVQLDANNNRIPTYDQNAVDNFAKAFTGWNLAKGQGVLNYIDPMVATQANHDIGVKTLLNGVQLPANQSAQQDLKDTLDNIFNHPNVGPFIGKQLIQHLVTSTPNPAYVARVAAVFNNDGTGVRGNLQAVVLAILLDPEARGDFKSDPAYGHLREPSLFICNLLRAFNAQSADGKKPSDGYLDPQSVAMGMDVFRPPSVFSYFPIGKVVGSTGTQPVLGPEFGIDTTATALTRANFVNTMVFGKIGTGTNSPNGTALNLSGLLVLALDPPKLVDTLDTLLMHGSMPSDMRDAIITAVNAVASTNPLKRAQTALYLVATSSQYQVQR